MTLLSASCATRYTVSSHSADSRTWSPLTRSRTEISCRRRTSATSCPGVGLRQHQQAVVAREHLGTPVRRRRPLLRRGPGHPRRRRLPPRLPPAGTDHAPALRPPGPHPGDPVRHLHLPDLRRPTARLVCRRPWHRRCVHRAAGRPPRHLVLAVRHRRRPAAPAARRAALDQERARDGRRRPARGADDVAQTDPHGRRPGHLRHRHRRVRALPLHLGPGPRSPWPRPRRSRCC